MALRELRSMSLQQALDNLTPKERFVLDRCVVHKWTLRQTGLQLTSEMIGKGNKKPDRTYVGICGNRVLSIRDGALRKLRRWVAPSTASTKFTGLCDEIKLLVPQATTP